MQARRPLLPSEPWQPSALAPASAQACPSARQRLSAFSPPLPSPAGLCALRNHQDGRLFPAEHIQLPLGLCQAGRAASRPVPARWAARDACSWRHVHAATNSWLGLPPALPHVPASCASAPPFLALLLLPSPSAHPRTNSDASPACSWHACMNHDHPTYTRIAPLPPCSREARRPHHAHLHPPVRVQHALGLRHAGAVPGRSLPAGSPRHFLLPLQRCLCPAP